MTYWIMGILLSLFIIVIVIVGYCNNVIKVNNIKIVSDKIDKNIDIVFVSDFHVGRYMKRKELLKIIDIINKMEGDYIFIGGDIGNKNPLKYYSDDELKIIFDSLKIKNRYFWLR